MFRRFISIISLLTIVLPLPVLASSFSIESVGTTLYDCFGPVAVHVAFYPATAAAILWLLLTLIVLRGQGRLFAMAASEHVQLHRIKILTWANAVLSLAILLFHDPAFSYFSGSGCGWNFVYQNAQWPFLFIFYGLGLIGLIITKFLSTRRASVSAAIASASGTGSGKRLLWISGLLLLYTLVVVIVAISSYYTSLFH